MKKIPRVSGLLILFFILPILLHAQSSANYTLYVNVAEEVGSRVKELVTSAKVSLAIRTFDGREAGYLRPMAWQDVPIDRNTWRAVFKNLSGTQQHLVSVQAPGYIPVVDRELKEMRVEETGKAYYTVQIKPDETLQIYPQTALPGSVRVAVLTQAPQGPVALTSAKIDILEYDWGRGHGYEKLVRSANTKSTRGKEGIVFSNLPPRKYIAAVTAPGFKLQRIRFAVEPEKETWLPIILDIDREKPNTCPKECRCDAQNNIIYCSGAGQDIQKSVPISIPPVPSQKVIEAFEVDSIQKTEKKEVENKIIYEVTGTVRKKLLFVIPVSFSAKAVVNAQTGAIEKISGPWWSFLVW